MLEYALRFLAGGIAVSAFAALGDSLRPKSFCPRALVRRTQKPFSARWKVTRSKARQRFLGLRCRGCAYARIFVLHGLSCVAVPA